MIRDFSEIFEHVQNVKMGCDSLRLSRIVTDGTTERFTLHNVVTSTSGGNRNASKAKNCVMCLGLLNAQSVIL